MAKNSQTVAIRLYDGDYEKLEEVSKHTGVPKSILARMYIKEGLMRRKLLRATPEELDRIAAGGEAGE